MQQPDRPERPLRRLRSPAIPTTIGTASSLRALDWFLRTTIWRSPIYYLFQNRPSGSADAAVGKTLVSSQMIDRVAAKIGATQRGSGRLQMVRGRPVGRLLGFGGEESAGASSSSRRLGLDDRQGRHHPGPAFRRNHRTTGQRPEPAFYAGLTAELGNPSTIVSKRPRPRSRRQSSQQALPRNRSTSTELAGEKITKSDPRSQQRRPYRWAEGGSGQRLVRGPTLRHREHLQDLRRKLPGHRSSPPYSGRGTDHRQRRSCRSHQGVRSIAMTAVSAEAARDLYSHRSRLQGNPRTPDARRKMRQLALYHSVYDQDTRRYRTHGWYRRGGTDSHHRKSRGYSVEFWKPPSLTCAAEMARSPCSLGIPVLPEIRLRDCRTVIISPSLNHIERPGDCLPNWTAPGLSFLRIFSAMHAQLIPHRTECAGGSGGSVRRKAGSGPI